MTVTGLTRDVRKALYVIVPPVLVIEILVTLWLLSEGQEGQGTAANTVILAQVLLLTIPFVVVPSGSRSQSRVEKVLRYALAGAAILTLGIVRLAHRTDRRRRSAHCRDRGAASP